MKISANSIDHKREHCTISKKSLDIVLSETVEVGEVGDTLFKKALDLQNIPVIEAVEDEIERTLRYAQEAKSYEPFKSLIFTSDDKISTYQEKLNGIGKSAENITLMGHTSAETYIKGIHDTVESNLQG
jgi:hypothetical protein